MTPIITIVALVAANLTGTRRDVAVAEHLPAIFATADPADSLWQAGRRAISDEDWDTAVSIFARVRSRFPKSAYVGDSFYWQAWALYQKGSTSAYRQAVDLLATQRGSYSDAKTVQSGESQRLATRIRGFLAQGGDEQAAAEIARRAGEIARVAGETDRAIAEATRSGSEGARVSGETDRAIADAARAAAEATRNMGGAIRAASRAGASAARSASPVPGCPREEDDDRVMALNALLQMRSDDALPLLKQVLARRDPCSETLRRKAVFLVSQKRSSDAADILMDAAQNDPDGETREQAVFWLSQVNTDRATTLLEQILKTSKDENLQDKAIFALSQTGGAHGSTVLRDYAEREDAPMHLREQAVFWLGQRRSDENGEFLRSLFTKTKSGEMKDKILFSLSQQRSAANDQFLLDQAVNTANTVEIRKQALFWAGQSGAADVMKIGSLYDKTTDQDFREQVIFVLSQRSKSPAALDKLIDIAKTEKNHSLREKAIFWLGQSRDPKALKVLQDIILKSPDQEQR